MPCSQMISTNSRPPRPSEDSRLARLPAVKARILNSRSWNIGSSTRVSTKQKRISTARPPKMALSTNGLVQPIVWPP